MYSNLYPLIIKKVKRIIEAIVNLKATMDIGLIV